MLSRLSRDFYLEAKAAEQNEDYAEAEMLYRRAIEVTTERSLAVNDLAGLLHQMGRTREAIEFLEAHPPRVRTNEEMAYIDLLIQLRTAEFYLERDRDLPRTLLLEILIEDIEIVDKKSLRKLLPNAMAVRELDHFNGVRGRRAIVSFATNGDARRALRNLQDPYNDSTIRAAWAPPGTQFAMFAHEMFRSDADWEECFTNAETEPLRSLPPRNFTEFPVFEEIGI